MQLLSRSSNERLLQRWGGWAGFFRRPPAQATTYTVTADGIGTFQIMSFQWSDGAAAQSRKARPTEKPGDKEASKETPVEFVVSKKVDNVSSALQLAAAEGRQIATLEVVVRTSSRLVVLRFKDVLVTSVNRSNSPGDDPTEQIGFSGLLDVDNSSF